MKNLFVLSLTIGFFVVESVYGMPNPMPQGINNNNSMSNTGSYAGVSGNGNGESNNTFFPVTNRRFSEGMINFSLWPDPKRQNQGIRQNGCIVLEQQQNGRESYVQGNANRSYINHVSGRQEPLQQNSLNSPSEFVPQEINGNISGNTMFLPILRSTNNGNQPINNYSNLPQQQYNNQGYFPTLDLNNFMNSTFNLTEVLQLNEQQTRIIRETQQELSNVKRQNESLMREIQNYRNREMYFFSGEIAQLQRQIKNLEECLANRDHQNAELLREVQYYKQVKRQIDKIEEEEIEHKAEINDLKEQLKKEKELYTVPKPSTGAA